MSGEVGGTGTARSHCCGRAVNLATTYSRGTCRPTTIGAAAFHFRVRDGNGWFHRAMVTRGRPLLKCNAGWPWGPGVFAGNGDETDFMGKNGSGVSCEGGRELLVIGYQLLGGGGHRF